MTPLPRLALLTSLATAAILLLCGPVASSAQAATVAWSIRSVAEPTNFSAADAVKCAEDHIHCDNYQLLATNVGDAASSGTLVLTDRLPAGLEPSSVISGRNIGGEEKTWSCEKKEGLGEVWTVTCKFTEAVPVGGYAPFLQIRLVTPPPETPEVKNEVTVEGGGASGVASVVEETPVDSQPPPFAVNDFSVVATAADGTPELGAGAHPWEVTTTFKIPSIFAGHLSQGFFQPLKQLKNGIAELPLGFIGNPQATPRCSPELLRQEQCPHAARVGTWALLAGGLSEGEFAYTGGNFAEPPSAVYNLVPEHGYAAEFGFTFAHQSIFLYAGVVHDGSGYHVRVTTSGIPSILETSYFAIRFFGDPSKLNEGSAGSTEEAFLTNPVNCSAGSLNSSFELETWEDPGHPAGAEATTYPSLSGCEALQFNPSFSLQPDTGSADSPAGLNVDLGVPQALGPEERATPELRDATVTLPEGLVVSPSAADGLAACAATGPEGINIGSGEIGSRSQDLGNPEATELGAGHAGGNGSPYDDGYYHAAPGHCPAASTLGTVEAITPLLEKPVKGHVYLATPDCSPCSNADAQGGRLLKLYIEIDDPATGTVIKLPGTVSADPASGRLTATFKDNPQFPFSDLKLHFKSGSRAALVTPPTCGAYTTTTRLKPWSAPETPDATPPSSFNVSSGPGGSPCANTPAQQANNPSFTAGTASPSAGAFSPFLLKLSRADGSQRIRALDVTLPPGLSGKLAGIPSCSDAQIAAAEHQSGKVEKQSPSCPLTTEVGIVNVGAGPGPNPFYVQGHAYLAGPYKGAPLSMAIITPAAAGPFDLGTVVVRAGLYVNPESAQITAKSDPIPTILAGVPLDVRSIAINVSRNQFTLNPTNCNPLVVSGTAFGQSSNGALSSPFQVGGCNALGFVPKLELKVSGGTKRNQNPALRAVLTAKPGEANIAKAAVTLPHSEFLDNAHIRTICTRVQFAANACPPAAVYGHARAISPLLDQALEGPVYLRSSSHELPDLVAVLKGPASQPIEVNLDGRVDSVHAALRNSFEVVPDAPVSKFVLEMQGGKKGLLVNSTNLCKSPNRATVKLDAQNGKVHDFNPVVANSCKGKPKKKHRHG